jgi:hypothetical protein
MITDRESALPRGSMRMTLKEMLENNATLVVLGFLLAGFLSGVGTMSFLDARDQELRASIIAELQEKNSKLTDSNTSLQASNDELDRAAREAVLQYINLALSNKDQKLLKGPNSEKEKAQLEQVIRNAPRANISNIIRDPFKCLAFASKC